MKSIFIDTNSVNENGTIYLSELIVKNMGLQKGEKLFKTFDVFLRL